MAVRGGTVRFLREQLLSDFVLTLGSGGNKRDERLNVRLRVLARGDDVLRGAEELERELVEALLRQVEVAAVGLGLRAEGVAVSSAVVCEECEGDLRLLAARFASATALRC